VQNTVSPSAVTPVPAPQGGGGILGSASTPYYEPTPDVTYDPSLPLEVQVEETQTGRFMIGVGVNSDAGVVGSVVIDEKNFDLRRFPTSFEDFRNGTAWRGRGQRFRLELLPGSEVQRYLINFQEPYLWDTPIAFGASGFFYDRRFFDWDEQRVGGRLSLGYQLTPDLSATIAYRGENVNIHDPRSPTPPEVQEVVGDNTLHGFQLTLAHDTRDSAFLATEGHYIELGVEQVVGDFEYPRATSDLRQYFLLHERPDGSGRHVLSFSTRLGFTGNDTPVYDHFFAGGFSTLRGFDFRGASPRVMGVTVGGEFMWINSAEYLMPITADDMLRGVVFCDFGTVEPEVEINDFRVAPGLGLRITVPALGPAPIALDFAFPVSKASGDDEEVFSFNVGFQR
jgi:outer membrane protein insertion porin family